jgi:hypothetical protein
MRKKVKYNGGPLISPGFFVTYWETPVITGSVEKDRLTTSGGVAPYLDVQLNRYLNLLVSFSVHLLSLYEYYNSSFIHYFLFLYKERG